MVDEEDLIFVGASAAQYLYFTLLLVRTAIIVKSKDYELAIGKVRQITETVQIQRGRCFIDTEALFL